MSCKDLCEHPEILPLLPKTYNYRTGYIYCRRCCKIFPPEVLKMMHEKFKPVIIATSNRHKNKRGHPLPLSRCPCCHGALRRRARGSSFSRWEKDFKRIE